MSDSTAHFGPGSATGESGHQDLHDKEMRKKEAYYKATMAHKITMHHAMHKAAEELRLEGKGSEDPMYENSKKNR